MSKLLALTIAAIILANPLAIFASTPISAAARQSPVVTYQSLDNTLVFPPPSTNNIQDISFTVDFGKLWVENLDNYHLVKIAGCGLWSGGEGEPTVPARTVLVLLPPDATISSVEVTALPTLSRALSEEIRLYPHQRPIPLHLLDNLKRRFVPPDPQIYSSSNPYPGQRGKLAFLTIDKGYRIAGITLFPIAYIPSQRRVVFYPKLSVHIKLKSAADARSLTRVKPLPGDDEQLRKLVVNPEILSTYSTITPTSAGFSTLASGDFAPTSTGSSASTEESSSLLPPGTYPYVIITSDELKNSGEWQPLIDRKNSRGLNATIVTVEWIYSNYSGCDNPEKIRNFIIDAHNTWQTKWVLLGGDDTVIPPRYFYVESWEGGYATYMPADLYYSCLDGNFNYDGDSQWGEPNDGPDGGEVDLYADVYVGRAPVASASDVSNFVSKTLAYEDFVPSPKYLAYMVGEYLGFGGVTEYAKPSLEEMRLGSDAHGYTTAGFVDSDNFTTQTLYEADSPWSKDDLINIINNGLRVINHLGHGNTDHAMKLDNPDLDSLTNTQYFFAYSQACLSGAFDVGEAWAEKVVRMAHGAAAVVMNARYGWGAVDSTDGPSQWFARQFWDAAFGEGIYNLGKMNSDSKEDTIEIRYNWECWRWCYYELNLFGDPELNLGQLILTSPPALTIDVEPELSNGETTITVSSTQDLTSLTVTVTAPDGTSTNVSMSEIAPLKWSGTYTVTQDGTHTVHAEGINAAGMVGTADATFVGDVTPPTIQNLNANPGSFNPDNGESTSITASITEQANWTLTIKESSEPQTPPYWRIGLENLVGYWRFDEGTGTEAGDSAGKNDGKIYGAIWVPGKLGSALYFDGVDDYVEIPDSESLDLTSFTVEVWVYPREIKSDYQPLIVKGEQERNYGLLIRPDEMRIHFSFKRTDGTWAASDSVGSLTLNAWNHVAMTYDGSKLRLYLNGQLDREVAESGTPMQSGAPVRIGKGISMFTPFKGMIDEVRIYNRALSTSEIEEYYENCIRVLRSFVGSDNSISETWRGIRDVEVWVQTSRADFEQGTLTDVDTATRPGDIRLAVESSNIWSSLPDLPQSLIISDDYKHCRHLLASDNFHTYFINNGYAANFYFGEYDRRFNSWTQCAFPPSFGSKGVLTTGEPAPDGRYVYYITNSGYFGKYDLSTDSWTSLTYPPEDSPYGVLTSDGTYIYYTPNSEDGDNVYRYDPGTDCWTLITRLPGCRMGDLIADGTYLYYIAYFGARGFYKYDPSTDAWTRLPDPPEYSDRGVLASDGTYIYYCLNSEAKFYGYDLETGSWTVLADVPYGTNYGRLASDGTYVYYAPICVSASKLYNFYKYTRVVYKSSGTYTSPVFDAGREVKWGTIHWSATTPSGTSLSIETRSSSDGVTWSEWQQCTNGGEIPSPSGRYLQYRANLSTSKINHTPSLHHVVVTYGSEASQGSYTIYADAVDLAGNLSSTASTTVSVNLPPEFTVKVSPAPSPGGSVTVEVVSNENLGATPSVKVWAPDNTSSEVAVNKIADCKWQGTYNVTQTGAYLVRVEGYDLSGLQGTAENIFEGDLVPPVISDLSAVPSLFTPDGDGENDETVITADVTEAVDWTIRIENSGGATVRTITGSNYDGLVGYWKFDNGCGIVADSSGNGAHGTIYGGATWVDGKYGSALSFDGVDDYVELPQLMTGVNNTFTLELWFFPRDNTAGELFVHRADWRDKILRWSQGGDQKVHFLLYVPNVEYRVSSGVLSLNTWYHVVGTYDGSTMRLYVNGEEVGSLDVQIDVDWSTGYYGTYIGADAYFNNRFFNGLIDEVRVYNRALSADEVKSTIRAVWDGRDDTGALLPEDNYTIRVEASDLAGNSAGTVSTKVTLGIPPELEVTVSPTLSRDNVTITVTSNENLIGAPSVVVRTPDFRWHNVSVTQVGERKWSGSFDVTQTGVHLVRAVGYDLLNLKGEAENTFEGDITPPEIRVKVPEITPGDVTITVESSENLQTLTVKVIAPDLTENTVEMSGPDLLTPAVVFYDNRYPTVWISAEEAKTCRDYLVSRGFEEMNADELKTFMETNGSGTVVVMAQDVVPDTVAKLCGPDVTIRRYLNRGGRIVWMGEVPFYYQGHADGSWTAWGEQGQENVLGVGHGTWDIGDLVTITSAGHEWGLKENWTSNRPANADNVTAVLASSSGGAAAWFKNFNSDYPTSGFVRIWDADVSLSPSLLADLYAIATHDIQLVRARWSGTYTATQEGTHTVNVQGKDFVGYENQVQVTFEADLTDPTVENLEATPSTFDPCLENTLITADISEPSDWWLSIIDNTRPAPLGSGAVGYWPLDEGEGTTAGDSSGNGNSGRIYGATWVDGKFGKALSFDGVDDYVEIPDSESLDLTSFTVEVWVYPREIKSDYQPLIVKGEQERNYGLLIRPDEMRIHFSFKRTDGTWAASDSVGSLTLNAWNHVAMTYDGSKLRLYLNGQLDREVAESGTPMQSGAPVRIGKGISMFTPFKGMIDEVRIYNRALSTSEIEEYYENCIRVLRSFVGSDNSISETWRGIRDVEVWVQTSRADFEQGTLTDVDTATRPGDIRLAVESSNIWSSLPDLPQSLIISDDYKHCRHLLASDNFHTYFINNGYAANFYFGEYDRRFNSWTQCAFPPSFGSKGVLTTGEPAPDGRYVYYITNSGYFGKYDLSTDSWTSLTYPPEDSPYGVLTSDGTYIYYTPNSEDGDNVYRYDPGTDCWTLITRLPGCRMGDLIADGTYLYYIAYFGARGFYKYDPSTDAWTRLPDPPEYSDRGVLASDGTYIYYCLNSEAKFYGYDLETGSWTVLADVPYGTNYGRLASDGTYVYYAPICVSASKLYNFYKYTRVVYKSSGTYTSPVFDAGREVKWGTIHWSATTPSGTSLSIETRSSSDGVTWSEWQQCTNGGEIPSPSGRYLQYRANLSTSKINHTPSLHHVVVTYGSEASQGSYTIYADAVDLAGNLSSTASTTVSVNLPPEFTVKVSPAPSPGGSVTVEVVSNENLGATPSVKVWAPDNTSSEVAVNKIADCKWQGTYNVTQTGAYLVRVEGYDLSGLQGTAENIFEGDLVPPVISDLSAVPSLFTPDGDGENDETVITADVTEAVDWTIRIENSGGATVRTITGSNYDGLVGYWKFDNGCGIVADSSGNGAHGTIYGGATWVDGKYGSALSFDGVDDYVELPQLMTGVNNTFTLELWFFPRDNTAGELFVHRADWRDKMLRWSSAGEDRRVRFMLFVPNVGYEVRSDPLPLNTWYHVVGTYDGSTMRLYINGEEVGSLDVQIDVDWSTSYYGTYIGADAYFNNKFFNGLIDEVRVYNRALSADEIKGHYEGCQRAFTGSGTSISVVWDGRDEDGSIVPDDNYKVRVVATDPSGRTGENEITVEVYGLPPAVENLEATPSTFDPCVENTLITADLSKQADWTLTVENLAPPENWWNPNWQYRTPITINNSGSALTNYQILITLDTASLISAGKLRSDAGDLRFATPDCIKLSYWIESGINTSSTKVWVKVPSIPAGTTTIYLYYGNPEATSESNGDNVFEFFDDFEDNSLDTSKWSKSGAFASNINEVNQHIEFYMPHSFDGNNYTVLATIKAANGQYWRWTYNHVNDMNAQSELLTLEFSEDGSTWTATWQWGRWSGNPQPDGVLDSSYNGIWEFKWNGTDTIEMFVNGVSKGTKTLNIQPKYMRLKHHGVDTTYAGNLQFDMDNCYSRKYSFPEPTTSVGAEEEYALEPNVIRYWTGSGTSISVVWDGRDQGGSVVPYGSYTIRVKATDMSGRQGTASAQVQVAKGIAPPPLVAPADGENLNDNTPTFRWDNTYVADNYELWVDDDINFGSPEVKENTVDNCYEITTQLAEGVYYWRVRAYQGESISNFSSVWSFRIDITKPAAPALISPREGTCGNDPTPTLVWGTVTENSLPVLYRVYVDNDPDFSSIERDSGWITDNQWEVTPALPDGTWYWKVQAKDNAGNVGDNSVSRSFIIDTSPPAAPILLAPENNAHVQAGSITFGWYSATDTGSGVARYWIQVDNEPSFDPTYFVYENDQVTENYLSLTIGSPGTYWWRVRAVDGAGNLGEWADNFRLDVCSWRSLESWSSPAQSRLVGWHSAELWIENIGSQSPYPGRPILHSPENAASVTQTVKLEWTNGANADNHRVEIDNDDNWNNGWYENVWVDMPENSVTVVLPYGTYWWRVVAVNQTGENTSENTWTFTVVAVWRVLEGWKAGTLTVASWKAPESWTGRARAVAFWQSPESWSGRLQSRRTNWRVAERWESEVQTVASCWSIVEDWSGAVRIAVSWGALESWSAQVNAKAPMWSSVENWTGRVTVRMLAWSSVESWTGQAGAKTPTWGAVETWTGQARAKLRVWSSIETWSGEIKVRAPAWSSIGLWNAQIKSKVSVWYSVESWTGTVQAPLAAPTQPVLYRPGDFRTLGAYEPIRFEWTNGANAENHRLIVDNSLGFDDGENVLDVTMIGDNSYLLSEGLAPGLYYWKVVAQNQAGENESGVWCFWTATWRSFESWIGQVGAKIPTWRTVAEWSGLAETAPLWRAIGNWQSSTLSAAPLLLSPANNTITNTPTVTLRWDNLCPVDIFWLQVDNDPDFSSPTIDNDNIGENSYTATLGDEVWYWRVGGYRSGNQLRWSEVWNFQIDTARPQFFDMSVPSSPTTETSLDYSGKVNGTGTDITWLRYSVDGGAWEPIVDISPALPAPEVSFSFNTGALSTGDHTIQIKAIDAAGNEKIYAHTVTIQEAGAPAPGPAPAPAPTPVPPVSFVENIEPYWHSRLPVTITAQASDADGTVTSVTLYYRYRANENDLWSEWKSFATDTEAPWSWSFTAPENDGHYEFYSIATDDGNNTEAPPETADTRCGIDTTAPIISSLLINEGAFFTTSPQVTLSVSAFDNGSGVDSIQLSTDLYTWTKWQPYSDSISFTLPTGDGLKTVYARVRDRAGNVSEVASDSIELHTESGVIFIEHAEENESPSCDFSQFGFSTSAVTISFAQPVDNRWVRVREFDQPPENVQPFPHRVFLYLEVDTNLSSDAWHRITVTVRVPLTWLKSEHDRDRVRVYGWDPAEGWRELPTHLERQEHGNLYYSAELSHLSVLAVGLKPVSPAPPTTLLALVAAVSAFLGILCFWHRMRWSKLLGTMLRRILQRK